MSDLTSELRTARPLPNSAKKNEVRWVLAIFYAVLFGFALVPVLSVTVPPLIDYPNHLTRMHILSDWENNPSLRANYELNWHLQPNLAMDIVVPLFAKILPIYDAGRAFIIATMLVTLLAPLCLRWVLFRQIGIFPVLLFLFVFNHILHWGFLNYLFTAGIAVLAFSGWIATRTRPPWSRAALFSVVSLILYVGHLMGLFVFGLLVLGYELQLAWRRGWRHENTVMDWLINCSQFVAPGIFFIQWTIINESTAKAATHFGGITNKLNALMSPVHFGMPGLDAAMALFLGLVIIYIRGNPKISLAKEVKAPLLLMIAAAIVMPTMLSGVWGTDFRLPTIIACILVAGTRVEVENTWRMTLITSVAVCLFSVRILFVTTLWHGVGNNFEEFKRAIRTLPAGATAFAVADNSDASKFLRPYHPAMYWHMVTLAIIEQSLFVPTLFTGHTTVRASDDRLQLDSPNGTPVPRSIFAGTADADAVPYDQGHQISRYDRLFWIGWADTFDYIISVRFDNTENLDSDRLKLTHRGSFFDLYKVKQPQRN